MLNINYKAEYCLNDNNTDNASAMLDILALQDMFAPEKALEILHAGMELGLDILA